MLGQKHKIRIMPHHAQFDLHVCMQIECNIMKQTCAYFLAPILNSNIPDPIDGNQHDRAWMDRMIDHKLIHFSVCTLKALQTSRRGGPSQIHALPDMGYDQSVPALPSILSNSTQHNCQSAWTTFKPFPGPFPRFSVPLLHSILLGPCFVASWFLPTPGGVTVCPLEMRRNAQKSNRMVTVDAWDRILR